MIVVRLKLAITVWISFSRSILRYPCCPLVGRVSAFLSVHFHWSMVEYAVEGALKRAVERRDHPLKCGERPTREALKSLRAPLHDTQSQLGVVIGRDFDAHAKDSINLKQLLRSLQIFLLVCLVLLDTK